MAIKVMMPPTASPRSRLPTPMPWDTPLPPRAMRDETSCRPVPEAETMPMPPTGTSLAKASGVPPIRAVPQSGPMSNRPRRRASSLRARSSSRDTLSLKTKTWRPLASAFRASAAAKGPGTETKARPAPGSASAAAVRVRGCQVAAPAPSVLGVSSRASASFRAASPAWRPSTRNAMTRSPAAACRPSSDNRPAASRMSLFDGVPIIRAASATPGKALSLADSRIRATESR